MDKGLEIEIEVAVFIAGPIISIDFCSVRELPEFNQVTNKL